MSVEIAPDGMYQVTPPVRLPEVLDVLIVGGGPAGTAAAFRAKELGLAALVVDYDDVMKRIRDYAKDKLILPSFGGGDKMAFPVGNSLVQRLHFDDIDKDDLCAQWRAHYCRCGIPAKIGVELTGVTAQNDGTWEARAWNHRSRTDETYRTRHVVIAIGRGVPRRFDIPGDTDGIAYRLDDPAHYVGHPACVIGGGTSAAEAVIAISNLKVDRQDETPVYWFYRGSRMPKVSKALSDVFFEAYVGNGNVRYYPYSEPVAVVPGPDRQDYLSVRIDRKDVPDRPAETIHLEFLKPHCIACIGEDVPEAFLREMGLEMLAQGQNRKKFMVVNRLLETRQPNVYVIGDLLSQAYLRADNFDADPSSFELVKHRGNIKSALHDGVFVAEVIQQRIDGRPRDGVQVSIKEQAPAPLDLEATMMPEIRDLSLPPGLSLEDEVAPSDAAALLIQMTPAGVDEAEFALPPNGPIRIGKNEGEITFPNDPLLADPHVTLEAEDGAFMLRDEGSQAGTFYQLRPGQAQTIQAGDIVRVGQQFLVFRQSGERFELLHYDRSGRLRQQALLQEGRSVLGRPSPDAARKQPDLALDHDDPTLSRFHVAAMVAEDTLVLKDLESLNGTYLKVRGALRLEHDDVFRVGRQMLRLSLGVAAPPPRPTSEPTPARLADDATPSPDPQPVAAPAAPVAQASDGTSDTSSVAIPPGAPEASVHAADETALSITFQQEGTTAALSTPQTVLDAADEHDVFIDWECRKGTCGCDPIRVVSGTEHMSPVGNDEAKTLKDLGLEPGAYRLACVAKVQGPVVIETMN